MEGLIKETESNVIIILGLPCAGKTTLGKNLERALHIKHISMGDLIRRGRISFPEILKETQDAYEGKSEFLPSTLSFLLKKHMEKTGVRSFIIDGGPGIHRVMEILSLHVTCVLYLDTPDFLRMERFQKRILNDKRPDDNEEFFFSRSGWFKKTLCGTCNYFQKKNLFYELIGTGPPEIALRQALSCFLLSLLYKWKKENPLRIFYEEKEWNFDKIICEVGKKLKSPFIWRRKRKRESPEGLNSFILTLKPGLKFPPGIYSFINKELNKRGHEIMGISFWPGEAIKKSMIGCSHFDLHYLISKWGPLILEKRLDDLLQNLLPPGHENVDFISAFDYVEKYGFSVLKKVWCDDEKGAGINLGQSVWALYDKERTGIIFNGHIPDIMEDYENNDNFVIAIHIMQKRDREISWNFMRKHFLGVTSPLKASPGSLRWLAFHNKLGIGGKIDFKNNGFHLSRGPFEGLREITVWFDENISFEVFCENSTSSVERKDLRRLLCDRPVKTENKDETSEIQKFLYDETAEIDFESERFNSVYFKFKELWSL